MIKILLVVEGKTTAVSFFRQIVPHEFLCRTHPLEFECQKLPGQYDEATGKSYLPEIDLMTDAELQQFQIVSFLRQISLKGSPVSTIEKIERLHRLGIKVIFDIDDFWEVPKDHPHYPLNIAAETHKNTIEAITHSDWITTTTPHFASLISQYNQNVTVLANCIDSADQQFTIRNIESTRVRFGWIGGVFHKQDIESIANTFTLLDDGFRNKDIRDKYQICLGGFNPNKEYLEMESIMTNRYKCISKDYLEYLQQITPLAEHISFDQPYRRLWGTDIWQYGDLYNQIDVALIPLINNQFNNCKSELKLIEAGTMGKCVIASDCLPYSKIITHGVNGLLVKPERNFVDWFANIRRLIKEPNLRQDLAAALQETIKEKFNIAEITESRIQLYKKVCPQKLALV